MKIAILSDSHDNLDKLRQAVCVCKKAEVEAIIHAGDFISPFSLTPLEESKIPVHAVLGNNDGERDGLRRRFAMMGAHFWEGPVTFFIGNTCVNLQHFSYTANELIWLLPVLRPNTYVSRTLTVVRLCQLKIFCKLSHMDYSFMVIPTNLKLKSLVTVLSLIQESAVAG